MKNLLLVIALVSPTWGGVRSPAGEAGSDEDPRIATVQQNPALREYLQQLAWDESFGSPRAMRPGSIEAQRRMSQDSVERLSRIFGKRLVEDYDRLAGRLQRLRTALESTQPREELDQILKDLEDSCDDLRSLIRPVFIGMPNRSGDRGKTAGNSRSESEFDTLFGSVEQVLESTRDFFFTAHHTVTVQTLRSDDILITLDRSINLIRDLRRSRD